MADKALEDQREAAARLTREMEDQKAEAAELVKKLNEAKKVDTSSNGAKVSQAFESAHTSAEKFKKRLLEIGKSALIFNVVSSGLRAIVNYMGTVMKTNNEYTAQLAKLKGALLTAFQPIYEFVLPGVIAVLRVLTAIVSVAANILSFFTGKTESQSAKNAQALNKEAAAIGGVGAAAKEAKKQLMGFDEINKLESTDSGSGGGGGGASGITPDFSDFDTAEYEAKIDELTVYLSGALLALGAILAFSGVNIPLGLALMALGAMGLAAVVKENWGAMSDELKGAIGSVMVLLGGAALALGAVMAFSGFNVPLGIALMAAGLLSLAAAPALDWNNIANTLQGPVGQVVAIASAALLALGLILAFSGVNLPLGIALIGVGAVGLVTVGAMNWNAILEKFQGVWGNIKQWFNTSVAPKLTLSYWKEKFSNIAEGLKQKLKDGVNGGIALFNDFISWLNNAMHFSWGGLSAFGQTIIPPGSMQLFTIPHIPYLAQGAVIPPNAPFLAMLGDQRHGNNIEAPEDLIRKIVREEAGNGNDDAIVELLELLIQTVQGIKVGDEVIGRAAARYQRKNSRAMGV